MTPFFWLIREGDLMAGIVIRTDFEPCELRALAKSEGCPGGAAAFGDRWGAGGAQPG